MPETGPEISDETLVKEYLAGDREAFATLYRRYLDRVTGYVFNKTRQEFAADREDLVQEIFTEALALLPTFREADYDSDPFRRWLYHVPAGNVLFQYFRRYWCARQAHAGSVDESARYLREETRQAAAPIITPDAELPQTIRAILDALPADERQAIELRYLEGLSIPVTARIMQRTEAQINWLVRKALRMLGKPTPGPAGPVSARPRGSNSEVRRALLTSACELLTEKGTCTGPEITARIGRGPTIIAHYFDSVGDLIAQARHLLNPTQEAPAPVPPRRKRAKGQVRLDLLNAARELFTEKGTFTGPEVARRAGVDPACINHYFGGIAGLRAEAERSGESLAVAA
ncbi:sigma-70 family RNA polymerase sigma factor [Streptosporangium saharense]|uniref:RNA polymerase sigma factor (Sigma-70 family) n=1 Tax=Streptosporangium saharense TaxID=1706840 RepID=A0A7W7VNL3_9ACTN|nr:sigma-70 family RNA polymerase sigma factor [Streptosporangium saharense]MBB4916962.1 RNA polymerase sigma factor (sigma-70 family) [Streptosporangium saharense]